MYISALEYAFMSIGGPLFGMSTKFPVCIVSCVAPHVLPLPGGQAGDWYEEALHPYLLLNSKDGLWILFSYSTRV